LPVAIPSGLALAFLLVTFTFGHVLPTVILYLLIGLSIAAIFLKPFPPYVIIKPGRPEMQATE